MVTISYSQSLSLAYLQLNTSPLDQGNPNQLDIVTFADGRSMVAWNSPRAISPGLVIDMATTSAAGQRQSIDFLDVGGSYGFNLSPKLARLNGGNAVMVYSDLSGGLNNSEVRAVVLSPTLGLLTAQIDVSGSTAGGNQFDGAVSALADGGFAVAWMREFTSGDNDIMFRRYTATGQLVGSTVFVENSSGESASSPQIIQLTGGSIVVVWTQLVGSASNIVFKRYDANGVPLGGNVATIVDNAGVNANPKALATKDGGFVIAYEDNSWSGTDADVTLVKYNATGVRQNDFGPNGNGRVQVNAGVTAGNQSQIDLTELENGFLAIHWQRNGGTTWDWAALDGATGQRLFLNTFGFAAHLAVDALSGGRMAIAETFPSAGGNRVLTSHLELARSHAGTVNDDVMVGDLLTDFMSGNAGNDYLVSGAGNDGLDGGEGNDTLDGGAGADALNGGADRDIVVYANSTAGVTVNLRDAGFIGDGGHASGDTYLNIESVIGSAFNDSINGSDLGNLLAGGSGNDTIIAWGGNDTILGGDGIDLLYGDGGDDYIQSDGGASAIIDGGNGNDTLYGGFGDDQMAGGQGNDTMVGLGGINTMWGGTGDDLLISGDGAGSVIDGGAGANSLWGCSGADYIVGGELGDIIVAAGGSDYMFGNAGDDGIYAGFGTDYIYGNAGNDFIYTDDIGGSFRDFVYAGVGTNVDTVVDFKAGNAADADVVVITGGLFTSFAQVQAATVQAGIYAVINVTATDQVYLYNVTASQLTANNVILL